MGRNTGWEVDEPLSLGILKEIDGAANIINETSAQEMQAFLDGISNKFHSMNIFHNSLIALFFQ